MKNSFIKVVLVCFIFFSCSSENEVEEGNGNNGNGGTDITDNRKSTGASANDLLSETTFKKMIVEIGFIEGFEPTETAKNNVKNFIESRTFKSEGVQFMTKQIPSTGKTVYTDQDIIDLENQHRTQYNSDDTIAVWILFVNGESSRNTSSGSILGTAYYNTSFVIYEETIHEFSNSPFEPNRSVLETSVINHEFGHILGLTNLGTALQSNHEDLDHPKHCNVESCLMYWAIESSQGIESLVSGGQAPTLDAQCLADLKANGGK